MKSNLPSDTQIHSVHHTSKWQSTAVVDVRIPIRKGMSSGEGKHCNYVLVTDPETKDGEQRLLQPQPGQAGSFFSILSTNQQPVSCIYELSHKQDKCYHSHAQCCFFTVASIKERWSPYKPGMCHLAISEQHFLVLSHCTH